MYLAHFSGLTADPVATPDPGRQHLHLRLPYCVVAGTSLFRDRDDCTGLFEIISGTVRLSRLTRGGRRYVTGFGFPGDIVGYGADGHHTVDCDVLCDARVIRHRPEGLTDSGTDPRVQRGLAQGALQQIARMQDHCMMLGRSSARERVAAFLSLLGNRLGVPLGQHVAFDLPMPRGDIADYLGLTTETVSRCLTDLRQSRLIAIKNLYHIVLLCPQRLDALAEGEG